MRFAIAQASLALFSAVTIFYKNVPNKKLSEFLKSKCLHFANDSFINMNNAVVGVFLQKINYHQVFLSLNADCAEPLILQIA